MHRRSQQCALALGKLGVKPGSIVATLAWNTARHMECWYGIIGLGAVCHTLNPRLHPSQLTYIANHAKDCVVMLDLTFVDLMAALRPKLPSVKAYILLTDHAHMPANCPLSDALCYEDIIEAQRSSLPFHWRPRDENAACGLCYTSGTTGLPKGVMYSHRANYLHAMMCLMPDALCVSSGSTVLPIVPLFHANSWGLVFAAPLVGAKIVFPGPHLDGASLHRLLEEHQVTTTAAVPTVWLGLLQYMEAHNLRLTSLKLTCIGGAACPPSMITAFERKHKVEVRHMWGMTETCPLGSMGGLKGTLGKLGPEETLAIKSKQGRPHPFVDMRIVDDADREQPRDGKAYGNLQVRGGIVVQRYFRHDGDHNVDPDGWFTTGDVATIDKFGHMQITDRSKDVIKSGGEWISSIEIENVAVSFPKVREAAVIAMASEKWGERPLLVVVPHETNKPTKDEILAFLEDKIAKYWMPDDVVFVNEIPHTGTGKISKLELREQFKNHKPERPRL
ncbi:hypothetical protein WJX72_009587 [[Myrmecia] bisecta]|uniref:Long-chain-fatty-acid--CoA ligase n=1 Tax=[Myrmecia] bisecta TaxID=41462 RepID=A0AAW1R8G0_9CHLO